MKNMFWALLMLLSAVAYAQDFTDSNLPIVLIDTDVDPNTGQPLEILDDPRVLANMKIIRHPDGSRNYVTDQTNAALLDYNGRIDIEIRGSSSQDLPKKGYGFTTLQADNTTNNNVSLLGMPSENDWILNGLAFDPSLIRDYLSYNLARQIGQYATRTVYCEVVINGVYRGLYLLQEKVKADSNRVNILKITTADNTQPNLSGGYITKADKTTGGDPVAWTMSSYNWSTDFLHELPKPEDVTPAQDSYIHSQFTALGAKAHQNNISLNNGFPTVIDIPTFIDFMMIAEISSNADAYQLSTFFHKDRNGKLRAGPVWDYNLTFGNDLFAYGLDRSHYDVWQLDNGDNTGAKFWADLFYNPTYHCYLSKRWHELTADGQPFNYNLLSAYIDQTVATITEASVRELDRWNTVPDVPGEIAALKTWLQNRINWIDGAIGPYTDCASVTVPPLVISKIHYNPSTNAQFTVSNDQEFIELTNAGTTTIDLDGIYFSQLGLTYGFPNGSTLAAGAHLYLASNATVFQQRFGLAAFGQYTRNLSNNSQKLVLSDAWGNQIDAVTYDDDAPWPDADGNGSYLQLIDTALDNSLASSWTASGAPLSVRQMASNVATVYPNPVQSILHLELQSTIDHVTVSDLSGKKLLEADLAARDGQIDCSRLSAGIYLLHIESAGQRYTQKIIKD